MCEGKGGSCGQQRVRRGNGKGQRKNPKRVVNKPGNSASGQKATSVKRLEIIGRLRILVSAAAQ